MFWTCQHCGFYNDNDSHDQVCAECGQRNLAELGVSNTDINLADSLQEESALPSDLFQDHEVVDLLVDSTDAPASQHGHGAPTNVQNDIIQLDFDNEDINELPPAIVVENTNQQQQAAALAQIDAQAGRNAAPVTSSVKVDIRQSIVSQIYAQLSDKTSSLAAVCRNKLLLTATIIVHISLFIFIVTSSVAAHRRYQHEHNNQNNIESTFSFLTSTIGLSVQEPYKTPGWVTFGIILFVCCYIFYLIAFLPLVDHLFGLRADFYCDTLYRSCRRTLYSKHAGIGAALCPTQFGAPSAVPETAVADIRFHAFLKPAVVAKAALNTADELYEIPINGITDSMTRGLPLDDARLGFHQERLTHLFHDVLSQNDQIGTSPLPYNDLYPPTSIFPPYNVVTVLLRVHTIFDMQELLVRRALLAEINNATTTTNTMNMTALHSNMNDTEASQLRFPRTECFQYTFSPQSFQQWLQTSHGQLYLQAFQQDGEHPLLQYHSTADDNDDENTTDETYSQSLLSQSQSNVNNTLLGYDGASVAAQHNHRSNDFDVNTLGSSIAKLSPTDNQQLRPRGFVRFLVNPYIHFLFFILCLEPLWLLLHSYCIKNVYVDVFRVWSLTSPQQQQQQQQNQQQPSQQAPASSQNYGALSHNQYREL